MWLPLLPALRRAAPGPPARRGRRSEQERRAAACCRPRRVSPCGSTRPSMRCRSTGAHSPALRSVRGWPPTTPWRIPARRTARDGRARRPGEPAAPLLADLRDLRRGHTSDAGAARAVRRLDGDAGDGAAVARRPVAMRRAAVRRRDADLSFPLGRAAPPSRPARAARRGTVPGARARRASGDAARRPSHGRALQGARATSARSSSSIRRTTCSSWTRPSVPRICSASSSSPVVPPDATLHHELAGRRACRSGGRSQPAAGAASVAGRGPRRRGPLRDR